VAADQGDQMSWEKSRPKCRPIRLLAEINAQLFFRKKRKKLGGVVCTYSGHRVSLQNRRPRVRIPQV
jgi:hypothetical protein